MVIEYIRYSVDERRAADFEEAWRSASQWLRSSPWCRTLELSRCVEDPEQYVMRIGWSSVEGHLQGFRASDAFAPFLDVVGPFIDSIEEMRHYQQVDVLPSLYEWAGGAEALHRLTASFYQQVAADPVLAPVFAQMSADHPARVADWLGEVFGGPPAYSEGGGSHAGMVRHHLGRELTEAQRARWVALMLETADAVGLPTDAEFRSAFVGYLEWGTRLAVMFSGTPAPALPEEEAPTWGWGQVRPWPRVTPPSEDQPAR